MTISHQEKVIQEQIDHANEKIVAMRKKLLSLDEELSRLQGQREQHRLLEEISIPLARLSDSEAAGLFKEATGHDPAKQLHQIREVGARFQQNIAAIENLRGVKKTDIQDELATIYMLNDQLAELQEEAHNPKFREIPYRITVLPWTLQGKDEKFFRAILVGFLSFSVALGIVVIILKPPVEKNMGIVVPERIARIIKKKQEVKPEEPKGQEQAEDKKEEKAAEKTPLKEKPNTIIAEESKPRNTAETKGVLAFKNNFADLMEDSSEMKIGASARITHKADRSASSGPQRSVIVAQGSGGSGGINTSTLSRQSEGGGGQRIVGEGVKFSHVASVASAESGHPVSKSGRPSRTDEEIQIVFDRYKSALYRIYNRELRVNPTLRGKMVLRIVIEPDGRVSSCSVKSTDLDSSALSADLVDRVLQFNFGAKEGVPAITILYPIDFLPAS